jgi:hypothetical protein
LMVEASIQLILMIIISTQEPVPGQYTINLYKSDGN